MKKTILITGSTDGFGKLAAIKLSREGHSVYVHGRNPEKLAATVSEIKVAAKNDAVAGFLADFSDLDSVRQMALKINNTLPKIDILINNAGVYISSATRNIEGLDVRFVVNYLAPCLLTRELMPLLQKGTGSRVINLSSAAQAPVSLEALAGKANLSQGEAYAQSKLALTMWSLKLAEELADISVIAVNPGSLLNTKMARKAFGQYWSSADKGADILRELAVSESYEGITGKYFDNDQGSFGQAHPDAYDEVKIDRLMKATYDILDREK